MANRWRVGCNCGVSAVIVASEMESSSLNFEAQRAILSWSTKKVKVLRGMIDSGTVRQRHWKGHG